VELTLQEQDDDKGSTRFTQRFDWVVGADGVKSAVRGEVESRTQQGKGPRVRAVKLPERNEFVYKTLPLDLRPRCVNVGGLGCLGVGGW
jgi:2-polyprenyl-6-methoxyphenol hydroxylase-like FAD-dependent oxidoreductase